MIALILSLFVSLSPGDSVSPWPYQHVDKSAKLSNSAITSVYMDQHDYVWLGTWDGLNRYDGSTIKVFKPDPFEKGTISNNVVRNFLEDGSGSLWIVTHLGINRYDRVKNSFRVYLDSIPDIPFLEYNIRACIGPDKEVWTSLIGKGISRYSSKADDFIPVNFKGMESEWFASVVDLSADNGLLYFLGTDGRLVCSVDNRVVFNKKLVERNEFYFHRFLKLGDKTFLAIANAKKELLLYDVSDMEKPPAILRLGDVVVSSLSENLSRRYAWLGSESGDIFKISQEQGEFNLVPMNSFFPTLSSSRIKILSIQETKQDIVWVGTDGDGVYKFLTRPRTFYSITEGSSEKGQISHRIVRSIYEDKDGTLFVGTRGGGLNKINPNTSRTKILNSRNGLSNDAVLSIAKDLNGNMWIGPDGEGVDMIEAGTGRILHFPRDFQNRTSLSFGSVYSICIDAFNDIWLGTSGHGVIHMKVIKTPGGKYKLAEFDQISHTGNNPSVSISSNIVYSIVEEKPNLLWFATRGGGIYRYNTLTKKIEDNIRATPNEKTSLSNNDVLTLHIDNREQLWIGSSGGLDRLFLQSRPYRIQHFTEREGLPNNTIHGILEDHNSNMWVSTNHGLVMYDRERESFKSFDANDGLRNNEFTDGATFQSGTSTKLFFGGIDGLDIVYPEKLHNQNYFPKLIVTDFQVRNETINPGDASDILTRNIDATDHIKLNYDQNFISLFFTTLDYWNKQKIEYSYFLENFDKEWNHIHQQQVLTLTNIPPGEYTLNINFTNENGDRSTKPKTIRITITPPFWKSNLAYAFYVIFGIGIQLGIVLYIRARAREKKAKAMDRFMASQLKQLNDYKLQFFTNIAHEFRTPLTLILGPAVSLLNKSRELSDQKELKTIYSNSLRLQKLIDELIQFRKIESGKDNLLISMIDLIPFAQEIVESFQVHAAERDLHIEYYPEPDSLLAYVDHRKIEKILINLISNAIKYSTHGGIVRVTIRQDGERAIFIVSDEGIGISEDNKQKIFESFYHNPTASLNANGIEKSTGIGLSLTKSLVQIHRGEIFVTSALAKGSTFIVKIPVSKESYADLPQESSMILSGTGLSEKISLEFESDQHINAVAHNEGTSVTPKAYSLLVVDDHASIVALLSNLLSDNYNVHKAFNGKAALQILEVERIDLVISDVLMPDMDGLTLCKTIKENIQTSHIPVILLTAKGEIESRIEGLEVGADSYIPKPFHPEHLFIRIEKLIEKMELTRKKFKNFHDLELTQLSTGFGQRDDDFFLKITQCIQLHLAEPEFNAETIADEVGMSKASLYKKVKAMTGLTPHGLIKQYRLKKAADLLRSSQLSVSEVIYETGFNSRSYFYKSFNDMYQCHPKDYALKSGGLSAAKE
jgi:signal transduction histidine kinase/ligand-binding sensor domain-containing protein/AraC-like DNA-binding protein/ActR/RegA family two-component response regulator